MTSLVCLFLILPMGWYRVCKILRFYHECEGRIEKSLPRIAVWHHEACWVMTNGDPAGWIFLSYPHMNNLFFFLLTTVFILKGTATLMITMFYMKGLNKPWILIPVSSKSVEKCWKLWAFEYLQIGCNGSSHTVGLVTSLSLIKYA